MTLTALKAIVDDAASRLRLPSVAVGISLAGEESLYVTGHRAFLVKSADVDTIYRIGSFSKAFIATAILLLQEQGLLNIDDPVVRYLPDFRFYHEELTSQVTPRDMLCHRTGLPRHDIANFANQQRSLAQMAESVRYLEPAYGLRERFHYQNHMFGVLSLLVERISGQSWEQFVRERILEPLGMKRTVTRCGAQRQVDDNYARSLVLKGGINLPFINSIDDCTGGAGSISASVRDMLTWTKFNLERGRIQGREVLPERIFNEVRTPQIVVGEGDSSAPNLPFISETAYGMAWYIQRYRDELLIQHGGMIFGFKAVAGFLPNQEFAFVVLVNQHDSIACEVISHSLLDVVLGKEGYDWVSTCLRIRNDEREKNQKETERLLAAPTAAPTATPTATSTAAPAATGFPQDLTGYYEHPAYGSCQVLQRGNKLVLSYANLNIRFKPSAVDEFVIHSNLAGMAFPCHFERSDGQVVALLIKLDEDLNSYISFTKK